MPLLPCLYFRPGQVFPAAGKKHKRAKKEIVVGAKGRNNAFGNDFPEDNRINPNLHQIHLNTSFPDCKQLFSFFRYLFIGFSRSGILPHPAGDSPHTAGEGFRMPL